MDNYSSIVKGKKRKRDRSKEARINRERERSGFKKL